MPTISIYLDKECYKKIEGNPSKIIQEALKFYFENKSKQKKDNETG